MMWWYIILALSAGAVLWACVAAVLRVRGHVKEAASSEATSKEPAAKE
jgi:ABC-type uncharacterized transport system permease subunit